MQRDLPRAVVLGILFVLIAILLVTHTGASSPYTYGYAIFDTRAPRLFGVAVNGDAPSVVAVTQFFYEPGPVDFHTAHNLYLPLHSFLTATLMAFVHSYFAASYLVNLLTAWLLAFAIVRLAEQAGLSRWATLMATATFFSLPLWPHYLGQPMQYSTGSAINFLVVMIAIALVWRGLATPASFGVLTAILMLNYDWYVFGAALATYVVLARVCRTYRDFLIYAAIALFPPMLWNRFVVFISSGHSSTRIRDEFTTQVIASWIDLIARIGAGPLRPFVATTAAVKLGFAEIVAMIYWPLLLACFFALRAARRRGETQPNAAARIAQLIVFWFVVEQIFTAAFDWENNPRRALPVILAFGIAYAFAVDANWSSRLWRATFAVLLAMSLCLAFADTLFRSPLVTYYDSGQATNAEPKEILERSELHLTRQEMPELLIGDQTDWRAPGPARVKDRGWWPPFAAAQLSVVAAILALAWLAARAALVPRWSAAAFGGVWVVSLIVRWL